MYITHDIPFALSRRHAQFAVARSEAHVDLLPQAQTLPAELIGQVFGAASFSVTASRLIFCEGKPDSYDVEILSAWHGCPKTAVIAAGGCAAVRECVSVFRSGIVTGGLTAFGYVDRDGLPDSVLSSDTNIKAHPVYEIEGFICVEAVFKAVARYNGIDTSEADRRFDQFLLKARAHFSGVLLNKEILNRAKLRAEFTLRTLLNPIKPDSDLGKLKSAFGLASPPGGWPGTLETIFGNYHLDVVVATCCIARIGANDYGQRPFQPDLP